ncbi:(Fe-S)-binding protein [Alkaliphilus pronyensis]|uniref:(Fe-S)-binding protein n=1 Tax=Alkaliphilus pronyensis TaxID=1482732 RepID=A0A6I0FDT3_9FIRM|nr:heterodisulfide reductase-related iron-sulfur binding cluster [Alkaliphilus pronyensis]KAB3536065.1 (Fe-S)-binding protein [Alkaliphilus pronyensis]
MKNVFAPGCALLIYKPHLAKRILEFLNDEYGNVQEHITCCKHEHSLEVSTQIINTCPGCDRRYRELNQGISTISLWELLAKSKNYMFPDYKGQKMSILDACPTRNKERVHEAIRAILNKMNVKIIEPEKTRTKGTCCGDSFYGALPVDEVKELMRKRASEMPHEDVVVYCVSCIKSMHIGGKKGRYLVDLIFNEETVPGVFEPDQWHAQLDEFIKEH